MRIKLMVLATLALVLALAPAAFALGGGGGRSKSSGPYNAGSFSGTVNNPGNVSGGSSPGRGGSGSSSGRPLLSASEPLAALAVGLGLFGARRLRRR
jgi:hypothetical protein